MATGDSIIRVSIIGDAKKLTAAFKDADKATGGLLKSAGGAVVGGLLAAGAINKGFDFVNSSLDNADKFADSLDRIKGLSGQGFADKIHDVAFSMSEIGLSAPEVADLAASFDAFATSAGVSQPKIQDITPDILAIAQAVSATTGKPVNEVIDDIGRAAGGNKKAVADLGIVIDKSLNPDEQITSILQQLNDKFPDVGKAVDDVAGKQDVLNAKWDNFSTKVGGALEGPLADLLDWMINIVDVQIPSAIEGWKLLGKAIEDFGQTSLGPLGDVAAALQNILDLQRMALGNLGGAGSGVKGAAGKAAGLVSDSRIGDATDRNANRNGVVRDRIGGP